MGRLLHDRAGNDESGYGGGLSGWLFMLPMSLLPLGFLVLLAVGIVWLVRTVSGTQPTAAISKVCPERHSALQAEWKACPYCCATVASAGE